MRPTLRPGSHVLRRDDHTLQVGLDPRRAVVLSDDAESRRCLELMSRSAEAGEYDGSASLDVLTAGGHLLDGSALLPLIPSHTPGGKATRADVAALARAEGDQTPAVLATKTRCRAGIVSFGPGAGPGAPSAGLTDDLARLLRDTGLQVTANGRHDVAALVGVGEPRREVLDGWMRSGLPHLLVRLTEGCATVGPFVVPGQTACLRCLDAHHTDADRCWPLLVAQYAAATSRERPDGVPEPVDSLLARIALAWAARDLTSYAEGRHPSTWSTTIRFDPHLSAIETRQWLRHPACGCAWG